MPQARKLDQTTLLFWDAQGIRPLQMQSLLAEQGTVASVDLIRLRVREARRQAAGQPAKPPPEKKSSATARRQRQLAEALALVQELQEDLAGVLDGWGVGFAGTERYERFQAAVESLESASEALEAVDVSWG